MTPKKILRRLGCAGFIVLWFLILSTPFFLFVLAIQREIVLTYSDVPNDTLRIWSIQEARLRGIGVSNSRRVSAANAATCTLIDTHFFLWQGSAAAAHECSCYTRPKNGDWTSIAEGPAACQLAGESVGSAVGPATAQPTADAITGSK